MTTATTSVPSTSADPLALIDVDHVRFYVGNAKQAAYFYAHTFGFNISQVADLTTGSRDEADYLLTQGNIRLLLTTPLNDSHPAAEGIKKYGDGVKDIALTVADATAAYEQAVKNGAVPAQEPREIADANGVVTQKTYDGIGRGGINLEGLPVLADEEGPFGSPFSDSGRTSVGEQTRDLVFVLYGLNIDVAHVEAAAEIADALITRFCSNETG